MKLKYILELTEEIKRIAEIHLTIFNKKNFLNSERDSHIYGIYLLFNVKKEKVFFRFR